MPIEVAIHGAAGRMGKRLVALASAADDLRVVAALESAGHPALGRDAGREAGIDEIGVLLADRLDADRKPVVIDFSSPRGAQGAVDLCRDRKLPLVMATTGLAEPLQAELRAAAQSIPVVWAPNMSLAVNLTMRLAEQAARALRAAASGVDVEILERHHRFKEDAPSGTALRFGELIAAAMGQDRHTHGRHGLVGARSRNEIGYHAIRVGDNPGEHTIVFGMLGETIELTVRASSRDGYAAGALQAARFIADRPAGLYGMVDVLGLEAS
ncbi:MAG: 4-hydroxy-tetrahydrodipicolinate reductase [Planctomycetes bacterium]|nr:4-hydroxy-tetrahydrodipicolinate reductase [Planctomycetota bacterium]